MAPTKPDQSPIDPYSDLTLFDIVEGNVPEADPMDPHGQSLDYYGFHISHVKDQRFHVNYDGHTGTLLTFESDDYDNVMELVADLNDLIFELHHRDTLEERVEWAGKAVTEDKEKYEENPDLYLHIPEDSPARVG